MMCTFMKWAFVVLVGLAILCCLTVLREEQSATTTRNRTSINIAGITVYREVRDGSVAQWVEQTLGPIAEDWFASSTTCVFGIACGHPKDKQTFFIRALYRAKSASRTAGYLRRVIDEGCEYGSPLSQELAAFLFTGEWRRSPPALP